MIGFPLSLSLHAWGMAFLVGVNFLVDLRVLGVAAKVPFVPLRNFFPLLWFSFFIALISGLLLLIAYPAKGLTNPVFYLKMLLIICALGMGHFLARQTLHDETAPTLTHKFYALCSMMIWVSIITLGRFLAYTYSVLFTIEFSY